jgi:hypothetical protein
MGWTGSPAFSESSGAGRVHLARRRWPMSSFANRGLVIIPPILELQGSRKTTTASTTGPTPARDTVTLFTSRQPTALPSRPPSVVGIGSPTPSSTKKTTLPTPLRRPRTVQPADHWPCASTPPRLRFLDRKRSPLPRAVPSTCIESKKGRRRSSSIQCTSKPAALPPSAVQPNWAHPTNKQRTWHPGHEPQLQPLATPWQ